MAKVMKCTVISTGVEVGYLSTWNAYVSIVSDPKSDQRAFVSWGQKGSHLILAKDTDPTDRWLGGSDGATAVWGLGKNYNYLTYDKDSGTIGIEGTNSKLYWDGKYVKWGVPNANTISCRLVDAEATQSSAGQYYYGLPVPQGESRPCLVRVWVNSASGRQDCINAGLVSQHEFCWGDLDTYDSYLGFDKQSSQLASGLSTWHRATNLDYSNATWCSALLAKHPSVQLGQLAIPGSHDSGTSQSDNHYIADHYNVTQDWSIINQLLLGVRYLDLRCTRAGNGGGSEDGGIWTHHAGYKGEKLERALNGIKLFLKAYPGEFVLVYLSHEQNVARSEVETEIARMMGYLEYATAATTYKDAANKLLVIKESELYRNVAPIDAVEGDGGEDGFFEWSRKQAWLETIPRRTDKFNLFEAQLTGNKNEPGGINSYPVTLAKAQYPLFKAWLQTSGSDKAGVISNDWFGSAAEVTAGVRLVIDKNRNRIT